MLRGKPFYTVPVFILIISICLSAQVNWTYITVGSRPASTRPVICSDPLGNLHVAWTSDNIYGELVQYASNQYGGWGYQKQVGGSSGNQAYCPSITADRQGFGYVVFRYYGSNYEPRYVTNRNITGNYWSLVRPMSGGHFHETSIEVGSDFQTHVFAQEDTYGSNVYYQKLDVNNNVVLYNITQFYSTTIDQYDNLHFVGHNNDGLFYTKYNGSSWSTPDTIDQVEVSVYQPSITCDNSNHLHIVFGSADGLYYINNSTGIWSEPELITTGGIFPNIVADENGKAHVAWYTQVDNGGLFYTNNINGSWLSPAYVTTINEDGSSATEDAAHVESKIALDPKSNTVNIVYIDNDGSTVKVAQTSDFNLRKTYNTDITSTLTLNPAIDAPDTLSTSASGSIDMLGFTISDVSGDGLPTKINQLIVQRGAGMSVDIGFANIFSSIILTSSDGGSASGNIYCSKIFFGTLDAAWKNIPEGTSVDFTVTGTLKQPLQNVDNKTIEMKINGLYDIIIDTTGSRFAYTNQNVSSDTTLFQVIPDHYEFIGLGNDFYGENLVEEYFMQLKIVDANGAVATGVTGIDVTLSAVELDGITPTASALQSTEGLTKTFSNGIAQWMNITYPDSGQFRILTSCSALTAASDTITILPFHKKLLICQPDENMSELLNKLHIDHDFYSASNSRFPSSKNLEHYDTIFLDAPYSLAFYFDSTTIKTFLESGTAENRKSILAVGDNALGYNSNSEFANKYFGGKIQNYIQLSGSASIQGTEDDPITDNLTLTINSWYANIIAPNEALDACSVILSLPSSGDVVGVKTATENYRTVFISTNMSDLNANAQQDSLIRKIDQWFQASSTLQPQAPELADLPDIAMIEDTELKIPFADWFDYVSDEDTPDEALSWDVSQGNHLQTSMSNDSLTLTPDENYFGSDTLIITVSDGTATDSDTISVIISPVNDPPGSFSLVTPEDGWWTDYNSDSSEILFSWTLPKDIDSDSIIYTLKIYTDLYGSNTRTVTDTTIIIDYTQEMLISTNIPIYWTVTAFDFQDSTIAENAPFEFELIAPYSTESFDNLIPENYCLYPNYPNPFNPMTQIKYGLPEESHVTITLYDINGRQIRTLVEKTQAAGYYTLQWNASDFGSGIYFYQISAGNFQQVRKCVLVK